jgi:lipopolysaccharide exporter
LTAVTHTQMARGAVWMLLFKLLERSLGLLSTLVLVRVLAPEDFGVVAMAMSFIAVAELVTAFGFDLALIQKQNANESHYHLAWSCNVLLGLTITIIMLACAWPIALFYGRPEVFWVVCALAFGPVIGGAENIGIVTFRKELDFRKEFRFLLAKKVMAVMITVPLAIAFRSYWALVVGMLFSRAAGTTISYLVHPFRPRLSFRHLGELMSFSKWILVNNIVTLFKERTNDFVIGSSQGPRALGLFSIANEFASLPHTELAAPVNRALLPGFAKLQADVDAVNSAFIGAIRTLAFVVVPAAALIHATSPYIVPVLFGEKWLDATPLMLVLSIAGGLIAMHSPFCSLLVSHGHADRVALCHLLYVGFLFGGLFLLLPGYGVLGAAMAVLSAAVLSTPAYLFQTRSLVGVRIRPVMLAVFRPLTAALVMIAVVRTTVPPAGSIAGIFGPALLLVWAGVLGALVYIGSIVLLWLAAGRPAGAEEFVLARVRTRLASRRSAL